ncbi:MAG TPA: hypothetical protein VIF15_13640 [Polyangiaceae bacterium]|jgi:hypothetical protein
MSSENNGSKPDSQEPGPSSGTTQRLSARAPSAWGAARDALAAMHNLDALLRSASVPYRTIRDVLPELRSSARVLREVFERARLADETLAAVGDYGGGRVAELERLLDATAAAGEERAELAKRARSLADELESAADLLALLERAAEPVRTEVSVDVIVRETARLSGSGRGREIAVRLDEAVPDCTVNTDPYVVGPLLALMVAWVHAAGVADLVVRARCVLPLATFTIEPAEPGDATLPAIALRILPAVAPTEPAARRVAEQIGATLTLASGRGALQLPCAGG